MKTLRIDENNIQDHLISEAVSVLTRGGLIIFPTETVYGVAADAYNKEAVKRVYEVKKRPLTQPLPVMVASGELVGTVASEITPSARKLIEKFFPGPLTLVLKRRPELPDIVTAGGETVAVRIPDHPVALAILKKFARPIVATSANVHDGPEPMNAGDAAVQIGDGVDMVIDSGDVRIGVASTILDMTVSPPKILRAGVISKEILEDEIDEVLD